MFYGRKELIERLSSLWAKKVPSLVVCRGRRRIGKSTLIKEFARKSGGLFLKLEGLAPDERMTNGKQLKSFAEQLSAQTGHAIATPKTWNEAFRAVDAELSGAGRKVLLLDEVSWMGGGDSTFPAQLKMAWDNLFHERTDLIVCVCGSVSTWIHRNILRSKGFVGRISLDLVVPELSLASCVRFWGARAKRLDVREILDVLSVTGGIPRYLEEVDPALTADENIRRMCFSPEGYLFREFNELFNDVISRMAPLKRRILEALAEGPLSGAELAEALSVPRNGHLTDVLEELATAGFVAVANGINPATGKRSRIDRYRLRDNYTRFFLRYVTPHLPEIAAGTFAFVGVDRLRGWDALMGLQFENLVLNNLTALLPLLDLQGKLIVSAAPYRCTRTARGGGVQIDLFVQTEGVAHIVEIKRRNELGLDVAREIEQKVARLPLRTGMSVHTALVYDGRLTRDLSASDAVDRFVSARTLLGLD